MVSTILLVILSAAVVTSEVCPNGWTRHDSSCYLFVKLLENWEDASAHCAAMEARLAIVETAREDNFLRNELLQFHDTDSSRKAAHYWLDGTDIATESEWVWASTEDPVEEYTNWAPGQPDDSSGEDCMRLTGVLGFKWDDGDCEFKDSFICERVDSSSSDVSGIIG